MKDTHRSYLSQNNKQNPQQNVSNSQDPNNRSQNSPLLQKTPFERTSDFDFQKDRTNNSFYFLAISSLTLQNICKLKFQEAVCYWKYSQKLTPSQLQALKNNCDAIGEHYRSLLVSKRKQALEELQKREDIQKSQQEKFLERQKRLRSYCCKVFMKVLFIFLAAGIFSFVYITFEFRQRLA